MAPRLCDEKEVVGGFGAEAPIEGLLVAGAQYLMESLVVEEERDAFGSLLHPVGVPRTQVWPVADALAALALPGLVEVDRRLGDSFGTATPVGLDDVDLSAIRGPVRPQPDSSPQSEVLLREACPYLDGAIHEGEKSLGGQRCLVDVANGLARVVPVLPAGLGVERLRQNRWPAPPLTLWVSCVTTPQS